MATLHQPGTPARPVMPRARGIGAPMAVLAAVLLGYLMLLPPQFNANVIGSSLPPYRIFLLGSSLFVLTSVFGGRLRLVWSDILIALSLAWISFAMSMNSTPDEAFTASVAHFSDIGLAYFFGRAAIRNLRDLRLFLLLMAPGLLMIGIILALESISHQHIVQSFFNSVMGAGFQFRSDFRMGLMRAPGPFPHPILAGVFMASFICLYWMSGLHRLPRYAGVVAAFLGFFTLSSGALLATVFSVTLITYNWLTERIANLTWRLFFIFSTIFLFAAELGTGSGAFGLVIRFASLNSVSGYARVNIWEFGSQSVAKHPWFGIGYADWERPIWLGDSVDNFWLLLAMRFGLPAAIMIFLATIMAITGLMRRSTVSNPIDSRAERGVAMSLSVFALALISVALWLSAQAWFYMLMGIAVSLANAPRPVLRSTRAPHAPGSDILNRQHPPRSTPPHPS